MAIAEKLGKDRRGNPIYLRDEDGAEIIFPVENKYVAYRPEDGKPIVKLVLKNSVCWMMICQKFQRHIWKI